MNNLCELYNRECINCGECDICDLDSEKHCDNCGQCIDEIDDYRSVSIKDFMTSNITKEQIDRLRDKLSEKEKNNN
ncbi:hypothetical protein EHE19_010015 [Ruminiclostridium herbifermentans]|uniref:Uncharacterized protein n=1 Tax=Ruminiclostridium herbifermentans TaxID=2488810 RepID=A0A4U7JIP9_9FIRM|nr:hypothetical protein [Ruminiclostridium herbifermentans]QNU65280.1 hypothetical protein EHE19_010015 [Ruminiclostridium herbifermentans]